MKKQNNFNRQVLQTSLSVKFDIELVSGILSPENKTLISAGSQGLAARRIVIVDKKVSFFYLSVIENYFNYNKIECKIVIVDAVESEKNLESLFDIIKEFENFGLKRRSEPVIAIGGGVLLDIVGLAANLYRRGVPYIKVPTTLLAIIDASVGVKTAVNFMDRRNRLGTYYPPVAAYLDTYFLKTLEMSEISSGMGEALKMAVVKNSNLFSILEGSGEYLVSTKFEKNKSSDEVITLCIKEMKDELQDNLWEMDLERYVDFGHSFSPIPEIKSLTDASVRTLRHGEAVALDVIFSCCISSVRGYLTTKEIVRVMRVAKSMSLPIDHPYFQSFSLLREALNDTMKHRDGNQYLPVPTKIGCAIFINNLTDKEIYSSIEIMNMCANEV